MKNKIKKIINAKYFHTYILTLIIFAMLFVVGVVTLIYNVEGENNIPFHISKISIISNVEGNNVEDNTNKWNIQVNQNNDIYVHIEKNNNHKATEIIESIKLNNFNINKNPNIGELKLLKPDSNSENFIFKNISENEVNEIQYTGDIESNIKEQKISNQGGLVVFRYANNNLGNFISNDDEQINHSELLKKININNEDLKCNVSFDITITLNSGKIYNSKISLNLPVNDVVSNGTQSQEITDFNDVVFKRK